MGPHGSCLLDADLALLDQLEQGQERDRHNDPVTDAGEQILQHDLRRAERSARRITAARSSTVTARGTTSGGGTGSGASRNIVASESRRMAGSSGGSCGARAPAFADATACAASRWNVTTPDASRSDSFARRVPVAAVEQQSLPQRRLGIDPLLLDVSGQLRAWQHGAALDQDQLRRDADERTGVRKLAPGKRRESLEVRTAEVTERHRQHVELALLDQAEQQRQRPFEVPRAAPAPRDRGVPTGRT